MNCIIYGFWAFLPYGLIKYIWPYTNAPQPLQSKVARLGRFPAEWGCQIKPFPCRMGLLLDAVAKCLCVSVCVWVCVSVCVCVCVCVCVWLGLGGCCEYVCLYVLITSAPALDLNTLSAEHRAGLLVQVLHSQGPALSWLGGGYSLGRKCLLPHTHT